MSPAAGETAAILDPEFLDGWSRRWLAAWNTQEIEAIVAMCSEEITIEDPALPEATHGHPGIRAFALDTFETFPDLRLEGLEPPCPSRAGVGALFPYRFTGTMSGHWQPLDIAPTGAGVDFCGVTQWRFRGERLSHWGTIYDNLEVARQMGLMPRQGGPADPLLLRLQHLQAWFQRRANQTA